MNFLLSLTFLFFMTACSSVVMDRTPSNTETKKFVQINNTCYEQVSIDNCTNPTATPKLNSSAAFLYDNGMCFQKANNPKHCLSTSANKGINCPNGKACGNVCCPTEKTYCPGSRVCGNVCCPTAEENKIGQ